MRIDLLPALYIPVCAFIIQIILIAIYFAKDKSLRQNNLFKWMLILGLIDSIIMSSNMIILYTNYSDLTVWLVGWMNRLDYFVYMVWVTLFFVYVATIPSRKSKWFIENRTKLLAILMSINIISWIIIFFLPVGINNVYNLTFYATGAAADVALVIIAIYFALTVFMAFYLRKSLSSGYTSIPVILGLLIFAGFVRIFYPGISISPFVAAVANLIIFLTFENPEFKAADIARKTSEQLHKLNATKDEFLSIASHQLRTPLTTIKGYLSMLLGGDFGELSPEQVEIIKGAFNSSAQMASTVSDFLDLTRIQSGKFTISTTPTDLTELLELQITQLENIAREHSINLTCSIDDNLPKINIDEDKILQVVMNFIDNAIHYSGSKGDAVEVSLHKSDEDIVFKVRDHGIGVPESEQDQMFTKFYRATNAKKVRSDGNGIGLYVARKIIDAHSGEMIFESVEGEGSTFGFKIPISTTPPQEKYLDK